MRASILTHPQRDQTFCEKSAKFDKKRPKRSLTKQKKLPEKFTDQNLGKI
jgi:hypothetical protein